MDIIQPGKKYEKSIDGILAIDMPQTRLYFAEFMRLLWSGCRSSGDPPGEFAGASV